MVAQREFLSESPAVPQGGSTAEQLQLMLEQADHLADIAQYLRRLTADVLCSAVVKHTSQLTNAITDTKSHEIVFELGGKPVEIYQLLTFSTLTSGDADLPIYMTILSMANAKDGFKVPSGVVPPLMIPLKTHSVYVTVPTLANNECIVNGPADSTYGGLFVYGFTIPDYDRIRGSMRS